jgi:hypothetical protein
VIVAAGNVLFWLVPCKSFIVLGSNMHYKGHWVKRGDP